MAVPKLQSVVHLHVHETLCLQADHQRQPGQHDRHPHLLLHEALPGGREGKEQESVLSDHVGKGMRLFVNKKPNFLLLNALIHSFEAYKRNKYY